MNMNNTVCRRDQLKDGGTATRFVMEYDGRTVNGFAVAFAGEVRAWVNLCPHRGTELDWQPGEVFDESGLYLICATHGALFDAQNGRCVSGPCLGASLTPIAVDVHDGSVALRIGRLIHTSP